MANPLFNVLGGQAQSPVSQMMNAFPQYMQMIRGKNPREIVNKLVASGKLSQQQLNAIQSQAQQMSGMFDQFKSMYGFM